MDDRKDIRVEQVAKDAIMDLVYARRSVRNYTDTPVSEEDLRMILEAARWAPSGENAQPWRYIVVRDKENKEFCSRICQRGSGRRFTGEFLSKQMHARFAGLEDEEKRRKAFLKLTSGEVSAFVRESDVIVIVFGRKDVWDLPFDTSAAIENMLLAVAATKNLGACWLVAPCIDIRDEMAVNEYFGIPSDYKTISMIGIGEAARMPRPRPRLALEDIVFKEKFGEPYYEKTEEN